MIVAQRPAWKGCAGSLMAEMEQNIHCKCLKQAVTQDVSSPDIHQCQTH